ncbi:MAG: endonuclease III domain-containing protein [Thermoleophilaceae bacterium]
MPFAAPWSPVPPRRLRAILARLGREYRRPVGHPHRAPIDELVLTVLSQNTNDRNRDVAYGRLRDRFASWDAVRDAPVEEVEEAIRPGGLAPTKAARIQEILRAIGADDLRRLETDPLDRARASLTALPGVGRKTAACVLLFSYGRPDIPVDTHVHRVGTRLGLFRPGAPLDEAHDEMLRLCRGADPYEAHTSLIRLGRRTCVARAPRCGECPLRRMCPYARGAQAGRGPPGRVAARGGKRATGRTTS